MNLRRLHLPAHVVPTGHPLLPDDAGPGPAPDGGAPAPEAAAEPPAQPEAAPADPGYPSGTATKDMTPEQQLAYWKAQARKHEGEVKSLRPQLDELRKAQMTDQELAIAAARDSGATEAAKRYGARLAEAEFRASSAGRVTGDVLAELRIDPAAYLREDGEPDAEAIAAAVARLAPPTAPPPAGPIDTGGGAGTGRAPSLAAQIAEAEASNDWAKAAALKTRQLAELASHH